MATEPKAASKDKAKAPAAPGEKPLVRLRSKYEKDIAPSLQEKFKLGSKMAVPKLTKICLSIGFGKAAGENNQKLMEACVTNLTSVSGQKAVVTKAKKSVSNFKLRQGMSIGTRVTLRGPRMYEFLDRLVNVAIPRIRDFRGLSPRAFDGRGNYSMGLQEQVVFPEIDTEKIDAVHGMNITICTTASSDDQARELLRAFGMPFRER